MSNSIELNNTVFNLIQISSHENVLLKSIEGFYDIEKNKLNFISVISSESQISIRLIDYFVTKFSKKNKVSYKLDDILYNVYQSYKHQLKLFQKKNFDPFARGIRIPYYIGDRWVITTIGQLNFFKWFISKQILEYVNNNKYYIELEMNKNKKNKIDKKIKKSYKIYKKSNSIISNSIQLNNNIPKQKSNIIVTF
jgi:hypothetical protein